MKWWFGILFLFIFCLAILLYVVRFDVFGAMSVVKVLKYRYSMSSQDQQRLTEEFFTDEKGIYSGLYGGKVMGRIMVWGRNGPRLYRVDDFSVYHYVNVCNELSMANYEVGEKVISKKTTTTDWGLIKDRIVKGDFVTVLLTIAPAQGGTLGNLREMYTYDYWPFINGNLNTQCGK